jgi:NAD(P)-dependent dehydrogenase (short-subunit alcohol dehydrogenase family)
MSEVVLTTGSNRGIGLALAEWYCRNGATVLATCRRPEKAEALQALAAESADGLHVLPMDVTDDVSVAECAREAARRVDRLDLLLNNAGVGAHESGYSLTTFDFRQMTHVYQVNALGPMRVTRALLDLLKRGQNPRVVNVSSGAGRITTKSGHAMMGYGASKAALNYLTRSVADELEPDGVCVVAMSPGWVRTEMGGENADLSPAESAAGIARTVARLRLRDTGQWFNHRGHQSEAW